MTTVRTLRTAALRLLTRRDYTVAELHTRLLTREYPEAEVANVIARLRDAGLVDDRRVAASHVRVAAAIKGRGRLRIALELEARGINRTLVREVLADLPVADETAAIARHLARKRLPARLPPAEHRRLVGQLLRRGFSADLIAKAIKERE